MICLHYPREKCKNAALKLNIDVDDMLNLREKTSLEAFRQFGNLNQFYKIFANYCFNVISEDLKKMPTLKD